MGKDGRDRRGCACASDHESMGMAQDEGTGRDQGSAGGLAAKGQMARDQSLVGRVWTDNLLACGTQVP